MKENYPDLSMQDIQVWVGAASFRKGESYFDQGAIIEPHRQGMTLKARCLGSSAPSYRVEVTLDEEGIAEAECSCPVGSGGHCKHVAVLLLTWLNNPEAFKEIADLDTTLEKRSKPELVALIRRMLQRYPDLEYLLEIPSPEAGANQAAINPQIIRHQVSQAFASTGDEWGWRDLFEAARDLDELLNLARQYQEHSDITNATIIYRVLAEEILKHEDIVMDDEADRLGGLVDDCVEGLGDCLEFVQDPGARREILQAMFNVYKWDVRMGGIGIGDSIPDILLENATPQEKELLASWTRSALNGTREWGQEMLGGLLLDLQAEMLDDEAYLEICRLTARRTDLVERLLQLGRLDEAMTESEKAKDYQLLTLADLFAQRGYGDLAERQVSARSETSRDDRLIDWLKDYAIQRSDLTKAMELVRHLLWMRPSLERFLEMKKLANQINQWAAIRLETLDKLSKNKQFALLVEIFLEEGEIDQALETLEQAKSIVRHQWEYPHSLELQVAKEAESSRPESAIQLYLNQVQSLIGRRGRDNYAEAANYLKVVQGICIRLGRQEDWQSLIASLRQENRNLPAFQDELKKAGL
ncbi:MAG: SWIM zinc finger family protein [Anaerolineales bacterium]